MKSLIEDIYETIKDYRNDNESDNQRTYTIMG